MTNEQEPLKIPGLLLEGDEPSPPASAALAGNPQAELRFASNPAPAAPPEPESGPPMAPAPPTPEPGPAPVPAAPLEEVAPQPKELPEAYGTGKLSLVARDPHCLYTHWDISREEQSRYNDLAASRHLVVRVHTGTAGAQLANEIHARPESRHCFIPVGDAATTYVAELGYYEADGQWKAITTSAPAATPPDAVSEDKTLEFANFPGRASEPNLTITEPAPLGPTAPACPAIPPRARAPLRPPRVGWLPALDVVTGEFLENLPSTDDPATVPCPVPVTPWTVEDELAFVEFATLVRRRQRSFDSMALVEYLRSHTGEENPPLPSSLSSPAGGAQPPLPGFWFRLDAELVVYGATEPDATVTIGGRPIQLRTDGTFSCRFALPDGAHQLPVTAVSSRGDYRQAELNFTRRTDYPDHPPAAAANAPPSLEP